MNQKAHDGYLIGPDELILITGATGFIGSRLVRVLLNLGFLNLRCLARLSSDLTGLENLAGHQTSGAKIELIRGSLLSQKDCTLATKNASLIFHLAAGGSAKSYPDAFLNTVVSTRNLLEASVENKNLKRFVNVSSLAVYSNSQRTRWGLLDETCPVESRPELRGDGYCFAKVKQDEIVTEYGNKFGVPYIIMRPGYVFGPGRDSIASRVGIDTFGVFLHLGGSNKIPFTYVDNCADAIILAGLKKGIDGHVFDVVDDDLPSSHRFLRQYKRNVRRFKSIYVPHILSYLLCWIWEKYSKWSEEQLPPDFNRRRWHAYWKRTRYSNEKLKNLVGWTPKVTMGEAMMRYFQDCRRKTGNA